MSPNKLTEFLDELESYLTDYADAEYDASSASGIPNREMSLLGSLEEVRTELKRNAAGIATQCPINKAATQCRFAINKVPPGTKLYTHPPQSQGVPEGYVLAPKSMCITQEDVGLIVMMTGWDDEDQDDAEGVLWFGQIEDDEGNRTHGLNISCSECMEEGAIQLVQFDEPNSTPAAPQADEWVKCSERLPTEAVQLSELMRGLEISSGFLTMPPYIFYLTGKKIADQAKEATDAAILRKQAEAVEAIEAKYRPYGLSESYTAFAVSENLQAEANRLRQQATDLEEPPS